MCLLKADILKVCIQIVIYNSVLPTSPPLLLINLVDDETTECLRWWSLNWGTLDPPGLWEWKLPHKCMYVIWWHLPAIQLFYGCAKRGLSLCPMRFPHWGDFAMYQVGTSVPDWSQGKDKFSHFACVDLHCECHTHTHPQSRVKQTED